MVLPNANVDDAQRVSILAAMRNANKLDQEVLNEDIIKDKQCETVISVLQCDTNGTHSPFSHGVLHANTGRVALLNIKI